MMKPHDILNWAHPLVRDWFLSRFKTPTEPQIAGWPAILAGKTTLISAPTGSGKTFTAFLACINKLILKSLKGKLSPKTEVLYISPLKALSNDIQKNLLKPLKEIENLAQARGLILNEITVAVRTGDTLPKERQAMLKIPPHILVTTPESLYILLTAEKSRLLLKDIKTVIVDEIHALANSKRGAHLALSLERLDAITHQKPVRIGLSATQRPIELIANFLKGAAPSKPVIINIGHKRNLELKLEVPNSELGPIASNEMWDEIYEKLTSLIQQNRSTLIFVNTRRLAERLSHHLAERLGKDNVAAHHGSLSRKIRLSVETKLKQGELKALVATASLELGIDIGHVDIVCQIGSPRAIATALQRIGRSGHWAGGISKGYFFVTTRDELVECAALIKAIRAGDLDELIMPEEPLDILAQQIIATCATGDWAKKDLFKMLTKAFPYSQLSQKTFDNLIDMLAEGITGNRGRYGTYLFQDKVNSILKARRGARLTAITCGGAIPDNGLFTVIAEPDGIMVGTLDEDFAIESNRGDIMLLGTTSWRIKRVESSRARVLVEDANGMAPSVPFWQGEAPSRTKELSEHVSDLREIINRLMPLVQPIIVEVKKHPKSKKALNWIKKHCGADDSGAEQLIEYILQGRAILGAVPSKKTIIAERFFDESGGMQLVIHAPFGARINKAWGLALRKRFCRSFNFELQAAATDNGINISLGEQHSFPLLDVFNFLHPNSITEVLIQAVLQSPLFTTRWRWVATRALALLRFRSGKKIPPNIQRMLADDLLAAVFPEAAACQDNLMGEDIKLISHPLIDETMKEILQEALDLAGFQDILTKIRNKEIQCLAIDSPMPSVFSNEILNANPYAFLDDVPLEERRARAVEMRRILPDSLLQEIGRLDLEAIFEVQQQAWPDIRNSDELQDALQNFIIFPAQIGLKNTEESQKKWQPFLEELISQRRAGIVSLNKQEYWLATEKKQMILTLYPQAIFHQSLPEIDETSFDREEAIQILIRGWIFHTGPITSQELSDILQLKISEVEQALLKLESSGLILRGKFRNPPSSPIIEWCERRLLARIHRLTLGKLRKEIEPVTSSQFVRWLLKWQHVEPNNNLQGERGLLEIIKQLQGFETPANAWERDILSTRLKNYSPDMLDKLCLSGMVGWGRISPHHSISSEVGEISPSKRVIPSSTAPITFFLREEASWMSNQSKSIQEENLPAISLIARNIYSYLKQNGASFFSDIAQNLHHLKSEIEMGLWELVSAGLITADGFDNLRALIDPKRRLLHKRRKPSWVRHCTGRWAILNSKATVEPTSQLEAICFMLLQRYGIVFRDLLVREKNIPRWRDLLITFRQLENRGEIRGGRFVDGFLGEQFALPLAVESLRAIKKETPNKTSISLSAADPLNLMGIILPGLRISATSGKKISLNFSSFLEVCNPL